MARFHFGHRTSIFELCVDWCYSETYQCKESDAKHVKRQRDTEKEYSTLPDNAKHTKIRRYFGWNDDHIFKKNITPCNWRSSSDSFLWAAIKCFILRLHMFLCLLEFRVELAIHFARFTSFSFGFQFSADSNIYNIAAQVVRLLLLEQMLCRLEIVCSFAWIVFSVNWIGLVWSFRRCCCCCLTCCV